MTISGLGSGRSNTCRETWPLAVDGCGIPVYATTLRRAARAFARFASLSDVLDSDARALGVVRDAMLAYPEYVAGTGQFAGAGTATVGITALVQSWIDGSQPAWEAGTGIKYLPLMLYPTSIGGDADIYSVPTEETARNQTAIGYLEAM